MRRGAGAGAGVQGTGDRTGATPPACSRRHPLATRDGWLEQYSSKVLADDPSPLPLETEADGCARVPDSSRQDVAQLPSTSRPPRLAVSPHSQTPGAALSTAPKLRRSRTPKAQRDLRVAGSSNGASGACSAPRKPGGGARTTMATRRTISQRNGSATETTGRSDQLASLIVHSEAKQPATAVAGAAVTDHRRLGSPFPSLPTCREAPTPQQSLT